MQKYALFSNTYKKVTNMPTKHLTLNLQSFLPLWAL